MNLEKLKERVIEFRNARDWEKFHNPKDLAISLTLEAGELLELFQWKTYKEVEMIQSNPKAIERIKEELGDVFIYALYLSHSFGLDPSEIVMSKMKINEKKYPVDKAKGKARKYNQL